MTKQKPNYAKDFSDEEIIRDWTLSDFRPIICL
jgi:hypothetical protein